MNKWLKIGIPVLLGLGAAGLNYTAVSSKIVPPTAYVALARDVAEGERLKSDDLVPLKIADRGLQANAVLYSDVALLYGRITPRDFKKGDMVFKRDMDSPQAELGKDEDLLPVSLEGTHVPPGLLRVGKEIGFFLEAEKPEMAGAPGTPSPGRRFKYIGPYRIVTIGNNRFPEQRGLFSSGGQSTVITVAIKLTGKERTPDEKTYQLLEALAGRRAGRLRVVEAVLHEHQQEAKKKTP